MSQPIWLPLDSLGTDDTTPATQRDSGMLARKISLQEGTLQQSLIGNTTKTPRVRMNNRTMNTILFQEKT
jgi:hypothetical protein